MGVRGRNKRGGELRGAGRTQFQKKPNICPEVRKYNLLSPNGEGKQLRKKTPERREGRGKDDGCLWWRKISEKKKVPGRGNFTFWRTR